MDSSQEIVQLFQVKGIVEGGHNHDCRGTSLASVNRELDGFGGGCAACSCHDGDTSSGEFHAELGELFTLGGCHHCELACAAAGDQAVDAGFDHVLDVCLEAGLIDLALVVGERGDQGHHDSVEIGHFGGLSGVEGG